MRYEVGNRNASKSIRVAAFPADYSPTPASLIGTLHQKSLSVETLAIISIL